MADARYFLGKLDPEGDKPVRYREVPWREFLQAWTRAALRVGGRHVCTPHALGFNFDDGDVVGSCRMDGGAPDPAFLESELPGGG